MSLWKTVSFFATALWVSWMQATVRFRHKYFEALLSGECIKSWGTRYKVQTLYSSGRSWELRVPLWKYATYRVSALPTHFNWSSFFYSFPQYAGVTELVSGFFHRKVLHMYYRFYVLEEVSSGAPYIATINKIFFLNIHTYCYILVWELLLLHPICFDMFQFKFIWRYF